MQNLNEKMSFSRKYGGGRRASRYTATGITTHNDHTINLRTESPHLTAQAKVHDGGHNNQPTPPIKKGVSMLVVAAGVVVAGYMLLKFR